MSNKYIDWSLAPVDATHWMMTEFGAIWAKESHAIIDFNTKEYGVMLVSCENDFNFAPDFDYKGSIEESITKRPTSE